MSFFYDWVSISQRHHASDIVGENVCIWIDSKTGEQISEGVGYLSHEGSYSTSVSIRAYNGYVEWRGNPSRWGRADNLFGYTRLRDCIDKVINPHMDNYGLPRFTFGATESVYPFAARRLGKEGESVRLAELGAVLTRVDITRNLSSGDPESAAAYIRAASCATYRGKAAETRPGSCWWGHRRNTRIKMYEKASEIVAHTVKGDDVEYRNELAAWVRSVGIVRQEVEFGRQALRSMGMRSLDGWSDHAVFEKARERLDDMKIGCTVGLDSAFEAFVSAGYTERQARTYSGLLSRWYMHEDVSLGMSRATWYRYAGVIRDVTGIDIRSKPDVAVLNTRVREVILSEVLPPSWYRHAA